MGAPPPVTNVARRHTEFCKLSAPVCLYPKDPESPLRWIFAAAALVFLAIEGFALLGVPETQAQAPQTRTFTLYVRDGFLPMPDGTRIYVWGFTDDPNGPPQVPAPPIVVNEGDRVEVTLVNDRDPTASALLPLGEGHTIHLHGLDVPTEHDGVPETFAPGLVRQGSSYTYKFTATHAGTYFYHCHQNNVEHQQMGMYGPLVVRAAGGVKAAYTGGPAFDRDYTLTLAEMGVEGHEAARRAVQDGGQPYNWLRYSPSYYFINDRAFAESGGSTFLEAGAGERVLVRVINAGYVAHGVHAHGQPFAVVASDGRPWRAGPTAETLWLGPGEKFDLLFVSAGGEIELHNHVRAAPGDTAVAAGPAAPGAAAGDVRSFTLYVRDGTLAVPDGEQIYVYGFTDDPAGASQVPGPVLAVEEGALVEVTVVNDGATGMAHGFDVPALALDDASVVAPGSSHSYRFVADRAGSFLYRDGGAPEGQQMGLYGALVVRPAGEPDAAYTGGPPFDQAYTMVLSEMDAPGHAQTRLAGETGSDPSGWEPYAPNYFFINGLAYPDTERSPETMVHATPGDRVLIRTINAGWLQHSMHLHGYHFAVVAINGAPLAGGPLKDTVLIPPGDAYDLLFVADQAGVFPFHDHFEIANTNNGVWLGGMHTLVATGVVHSTPASPPTAPEVPPGAQQVYVRDNFYSPSRLTIKAGESVVWEHQGRVEHTVTNLQGQFDSGVLRGGDLFVRTFTAPGRYDYFCRFHITNRGSITVE